jgi:hypothetical protein
MVVYLRFMKFNAVFLFAEFWQACIRGVCFPAVLRTIGSEDENCKNHEQ